MGEEENIKWYCIAVACAIAFMSAKNAIDTMAEKEVAKAAMENGYEQRVDEKIGKPIWVKHQENQ